MYKASPPVSLPAMAKTTAANEAAVPAVADFYNITTTYAQMKAGYANPIAARFPALCEYDRARLSFAEVAVAGGPTSAVLTLYRLTSDGLRQVVGTSALTNGAFPPIEFDVVPHESWALQVTLAGGSSPTVTLTPLVQGYFRAGLATT